MRVWVGHKLAGFGVCLGQTGRFWMVRKFIYLNFGSNIWILAQHIWVWHDTFEIWRHIFESWRYIFEFWRQNKKIGSFRMVLGGWVGPPDLREDLSSVSGKKCSACPLLPLPGTPWQKTQRVSMCVWIIYSRRNICLPFPCLGSHERRLEEFYPPMPHCKLCVYVLYMYIVYIYIHVCTCMWRIISVKVLL